MRTRLYCKIFGHDFRILHKEGRTRRFFYTDYCRNCGLNKHELFRETTTTIDRIIITKLGKNKTPYLLLKGMDTEKCVICQRKTETTSHHIIPKRCNVKDSLMKELRIRVCDQCNKKLHPENGEIDGKKIIEKQDKTLVSQRREIKKIKEDRYSKILKDLTVYRSIYLGELLQRTQLMKNTGKEKEIYPTQKYYEGKIKEIDRIKDYIKKIK